MKRLTAPLCILACLLPALPGAAAPSDAAGRLHDLFAREWEARLRDNPLLASAVGRHEYDALLPRVTLAELERRNADARERLAELAAIDRSRLPAQDVENAAIWQKQLEDRIAEFDLGAYQMPFNADSGFHSGFAQLPEQMPFSTVRDYESYLSRLRAWPRYVGEQIELMRLGIRRGFTVPRVVLAGYDKTISSHVVDDPEKSVFYHPFEHFPAGVPAAEQARLRRAGREAVLGSVVPGYRTFLDFYESEYLPHARQTIAAADLPNGRAFYAHQIERYTTL
nr:DUF885 domain-containing protein [Acidobacteriota bacterium]